MGSLLPIIDWGNLGMSPPPPPTAIARPTRAAGRTLSKGSGRTRWPTRPAARQGPGRRSGAGCRCDLVPGPPCVPAAVRTDRDGQRSPPRVAVCREAGQLDGGSWSLIMEGETGAERVLALASESLRSGEVLAVRGPGLGPDGDRSGPAASRFAILAVHCTASGPV